LDIFIMKPSVVAIIQARMSSSRLPGKVLEDIGGQPMLVRVFERARRAATVQQVAVATTTDASDEAVERLCRERDYPCYRGSLHDVLDRYYQAARTWKAEIIVRLTADCPVIDPGLVDDAVNALFEPPAFSHQPSAIATPGPSTSNPQLLYNPAGVDRRATSYDFVANRLPPPWGRTYPVGLDVEVCTFAGLETAWKEASLPHQREHVMPFIYDHPERFRIKLLNHTQDLSGYRWTVDTAEDLEVLRKVYASFGGRDDFSWLEVLDLFEHEPELRQLNAQVRHKDYREVDKRNDLKI
jgi:spore coat polysaccharide biosynthesis protein SpsF